jgi:HEAT repeat protein
MADSIQSLIDSFANPYRRVADKEDAVNKLRGLGARAVDALIDAVDPKHCIPREIDKDNRDEARQMYAARTLGLMGTAATKAAPALADLFARSPTSLIKREAALALSRIGPSDDATDNADVVYLMVSALNGVNDIWHTEVREAAALTLGAYGSYAKSAVPTLIACLLEDSERMRDAAAQALTKLGPASAPVLLEILRDRAHIRTQLKEKSTLVIGAWAKTFAAPVAGESLFERGLRILMPLLPRSPELHALLSEIATSDPNSQLQALARQVKSP